MRPASAAPTRTTMLSRRRIPAASTTNGCLLVCLIVLVLSWSSAHALTSTKRGGGGTTTFRHPSALRLTPPSTSSSIESSYWGTRISSQRVSEQQSRNRQARMDLEVPNPTYTTTTKTTTTTTNGPSSSRRNPGSWLNLPAAMVRIPAATTTSKSTSNGDATSSSCLPTPYFQHFWDRQVEVMTARLHNLQEIPLPASSSASTTSSHDMSVVENDTSRMVTKTFKSDEYSYIRMTMLTGKHSQVFTSVWYPSSPHLPILACDLLQFGGASASQQQRHLCIVDYQPVIVPSDGEGDVRETDDDVAQHNQDIDQRVHKIRQQYPGLHGQMSQRFYPEGSPFFSSQMLLGRHLRSTPSASTRECKAPGDDDSSPPAYETSHDMVKDVYEAWQLYMDEHVSWTQQEQVQEKDSSSKDYDLRQQRHAKYDKFSSQYDPALPMLSHMYGAEFADAYVHDVLFPLSRQRQ